MIDTKTLDSMKPIFTKGIALHKKIINHITTLVDKIVGLQGMPENILRQHVENHLENFDDLGYAKMMGGTEEYCNERKALIAGYKDILAPFIQNTETMLCGSMDKNSTKLSKAHSLFSKMRNELPYYRQLADCVNLISLFAK